MERIGDLLELLYTAWDRFRSVHAVFTEWTNRPILEEAWRKQMIAGPIRPKGSATPLMVEGIKTVLGSVFHKIKAVNHIKSCESSEIFTIRMWMEKEPFRWRQEVERDGKNLWVCVVNDNIWWEYSAGKLLTNQIPQGLQARRIKTHKHPYITGERITHPVLDPSFLLTGYSLGIVGHTIHAGRRVLKVHALPKKDKEVEWLLHKADEYELLVDEELL